MALLHSTNPEDQPDGTYRLSERAITIWTRVLVAVIIAGAAVGLTLIIVAAVLESDVVAIVGMSVLGAGILLPLLLGAYLGGESLARFGGLVGLALFLGIVGGAAGLVLHQWWVWLGLGLLVAATIGFFLMGFHRSVPMSIAGTQVRSRRRRDLVPIIIGVLGAGCLIASAWVGTWLMVVGFVLAAVPVAWSTFGGRRPGAHSARRDISPGGSSSRAS